MTYTASDGRSIPSECLGYDAKNVPLGNQPLSPTFNMESTKKPVMQYVVTTTHATDNGSLNNANADDEVF